MPLSKVASSIRQGRDRGVEEVEEVMTGEAGDERPEVVVVVLLLVVVVGVQEGRGVESGSNGRVYWFLPLVTCC